MNLDERYMQYMANGMIEASDAELAAAEKPAGFEVSPIFGAAAERPKTGAVEAAGTVVSGIAASVPAGLAGIYEYIKTQDPTKAQARISQIQQALTAIPQTEEGMKALKSVGKFMEAIGVTGEMAGDAFFNAAQKAGAGEKASAIAGTIGNIFADPINLITLGTLGSGIKAVRKGTAAATKAVKKSITKKNVGLGVAGGAMAASPSETDKNAEQQ